MHLRRKALVHVVEELRVGEAFQERRVVEKGGVAHAEFRHLMTQECGCVMRVCALSNYASARSFVSCSAIVACNVSQCKSV